MKLQKKMFREVQLWQSSEKKRVDFVKDKEYTLAKFDYWVSKHNKANKKPSIQQFKEIPMKKEIELPEVNATKTLQIETPSGIKITIYK